jgi:hypothetical protein
MTRKLVLGAEGFLASRLYVLRVVVGAEGWPACLELYKFRSPFSVEVLLHPKIRTCQMKKKKKKKKKRRLFVGRSLLGAFQEYLTKCLVLTQRCCFTV